MKYTLGALVALLVVSKIFAQTGNTAADYGIQAGTELAQAIANRDFESTMGKLATKVGPYLGMVGPVIGILFSTLGIRQDSVELAYMRRMFNRMESRFDQIDNKLDDIARKIDWSSVKCQFSTYESKIRSLQVPLDRFYQARNNVSLMTYRDDFVRRYENEYAESTQMLFDHIISGGSIFAGNLLTEVIRATDYDRKEIQAFMLGLTKLILQGTQIEMAYYKFERPTMLENHKNVWTTQIGQMRRAIKAADDKVASSYDPGAMNEAKDILYRNRGQSNEAVANKIFEAVNTKYYWRNWFVAVYDPVRGAEPHWISVSGGNYAFRYHGYNLLLASNAKDTSAVDRSSARSILEMLPIFKEKKSWWGMRKKMYAKEIFSLAYPILTKYYTLSAFGLVEHTAHLSVKADWNRLVTHTKLGPYQRNGHRHGYTFFWFQ